MQQPLNPNSNLSPNQPQPLQDSSSTIKSSKNGKQQKLKMPTPQELITHYESQGMNPQEASLKVIDDLQHLLFRVVTSRGGGGGAEKVKPQELEGKVPKKDVPKDDKH